MNEIHYADHIFQKLYKKQVRKSAVYDCDMVNTAAKFEQLFTCVVSLFIYS